MRKGVAMAAGFDPNSAIEPSPQSTGLPQSHKTPLSASEKGTGEVAGRLLETGSSSGKVPAPKPKPPDPEASRAYAATYEKMLHDFPKHGPGPNDSAWSQAKAAFGKKHGDAAVELLQFFTDHKTRAAATVPRYEYPQLMKFFDTILEKHPSSGHEILDLIIKRRPIDNSTFYILSQSVSILENQGADAFDAYVTPLLTNVADRKSLVKLLNSLVDIPKNTMAEKLEAVAPEFKNSSKDSSSLYVVESILRYKGGTDAIEEAVKPLLEGVDRPDARSAILASISTALPLNKDVVSQLKKAFAHLPPNERAESIKTILSLGAKSAAKAMEALVELNPSQRGILLNSLRQLSALAYTLQSWAGCHPSELIDSLLSVPPNNEFPARIETLRMCVAHITDIHAKGELIVKAARMDPAKLRELLTNLAPYVDDTVSPDLRSQLLTATVTNRNYGPDAFEIARPLIEGYEKTSDKIDIFVMIANMPPGERPQLLNNLKPYLADIPINNRAFFIQSGVRNPELFKLAAPLTEGVQNPLVRVDTIRLLAQTADPNRLIERAKEFLTGCLPEDRYNILLAVKNILDNDPEDLKSCSELSKEINDPNLRMQLLLAIGYDHKTKALCEAVTSRWGAGLAIDIEYHANLAAKKRAVIAGLNPDQKQVFLSSLGKVADERQMDLLADVLVLIKDVKDNDIRARILGAVMNLDESARATLKTYLEGPSSDEKTQMLAEVIKKNPQALREMLSNLKPYCDNTVLGEEKARLFLAAARYDNFGPAAFEAARSLIKAETPTVVKILVIYSVANTLVNKRPELLAALKNHFSDIPSDQQATLFVAIQKNPNRFFKAIPWIEGIGNAAARINTIRVFSETDDIEDVLKEASPFLDRCPPDDRWSIVLSVRDILERGENGLEELKLCSRWSQAVNNPNFNRNLLLVAAYKKFDDEFHKTITTRHPGVAAELERFMKETPPAA